MKIFDAKKEWVIWLMILAPLVVIFLNWDQFPSRIPTHFNVAGEPDSWGSKAALFIGPAVGIGMYFLMLFIPLADPKRLNYARFERSYYIIRVAMHAFLSAIALYIAGLSLGHKYPVERVVPGMICVLFMVIGNVLGTIRPNYFVGIRTPWTLSSEDAWKRTHRVVARVWVGLSALMLVLVFLLPGGSSIALAFGIFVFILVVFSILYSFLVSKKPSA